MAFSGLLRIPRLMWRDFIMRASDATFFFDDLMAAYFFTDTGYQYTWSKLDVHRTLLNDAVRVGAFKKALEEAVSPGVRVLDLGTGTGILAFLAARAGAGHVVGVDSASIIDVAREAGRRSGFQNVEFIRADLRDLEVEKVDLIICELIGLYITDEGMTYKVRNALRHLKAGGKVMPERIDIYIAPVESPDAGLGFWRTLYGIDYSGVGSVPHEARNYDMASSRFLSQARMIASIDMTGKDDPRISFDGEFAMESDGQFHGFVMYWQARLSPNVTLTTHPKEPMTHWKQIFLPYDRRLDVVRGDRIRAQVKAVLKNTKWKWNFTPK